MGMNIRKCLLILTIALLCASVSHAEDKVVCDCHVKNDKTSCEVSREVKPGNECACVKKTMYGKRKFKADACVFDDSSAQ